MQEKLKALGLNTERKQNTSSNGKRILSAVITFEISPPFVYVKEIKSMHENREKTHTKNKNDVT